MCIGPNRVSITTEFVITELIVVLWLIRVALFFDLFELLSDTQVLHPVLMFYGLQIIAKKIRKLSLKVGA